MNKYIINAIYCAAGAVLFTAANPANAQSRSSRKKQEAAKAAKTAAAAAAAETPKPGIQSFNAYIKGKKPVQQGMFKTYKINDKWHFEIPDSLLGREMLVVTRILRAPSGMPTNNEQYGGEQLNDQVWTWERRGKQIFLNVPTYNVVADKNSDMFNAVHNSHMNAILASFDIKAYNADSTGVIIDVNDFYNGDINAIAATKSQRDALKISGLDASRSFIDTIKSYPKNIEVATTKTYRAAEPPGDRSTGAFTMALNTSMILLPVQGAKPRIMDRRVGYFGQSQVDYGTTAQKAERTYYIHRWQLVPKDTAAYMRGELVEPVKPIVIYVDPATPAKWVPYLIQGINDWNAAFEQAGFKNAIMGKRAPTPQEDPEFSVDDSRYSVLRYFASDIMNAYGPHVSDPRTGQILETHIGWYHNVMNLLRNWFFVQTSATNPAARHARFSDDTMGTLIRFVSSHEVGHTLGLPHNFGSSYAYPVDSLRSKTFTAKYATAPSIMDYARFNYIAQPGDGVTAIYPGIGTYDKWAVKWGYTWFPGNLTPQQERAKLDELTMQHAGDKMYFFGRQGTSYDPRLQSEDLGDDAMKASTYGIANLKRVLPNLEEWTYTKGKDYSDLEELYNEIINQYNRYMGHVLANVGGMYENNKTFGQQGSVFSPVPKTTQRRAIQFYNAQLFNIPLWLIDTRLLGKFDNGITLDRIKAVQVSVAKRLMAPERMARMLDAETKFGAANTYTISEMFADLHNGIFNAGRPDAFKRNLQRGYIEQLRSLMQNEQTLPRGMQYKDAASVGMTPVDVSLSDIRPLVRMELNNVLSIVRQRAAANTGIAKAHYTDLATRIQDILNPKFIKLAAQS